MDELRKVIKHMTRLALRRGYAVLGVSNGTYFMYSKEKLKEILAGMEEKGDETILIFVESGGQRAESLPEPDSN